MVRFAPGKRFVAPFAIPNIRNGNLEDIEPMLPRAAIDIQYFWLWVDDLPDGDRLASIFDIARVYAALIRSYDKDATRESARNEAIALSALRIGMTEMYRLTKADLSPGEIDSKTLKWTKKKGKSGSAAAEATDTGTVIGSSSQKGKDKPKAETPVEPESGDMVVGGDSEFAVYFEASIKDTAERYLTEWEEETATEVLMAAHHVSLAAAVVVCQGHSIVKCGHHFLSKVEIGMRGAWDGVKKQLLSKFGKGAGEWAGFSMASWEDVAFHKAGHPIDMGLKVKFAQDPEVAERVKKADWSSIGGRLPATEPDFELARVAWALVEKVKVTLVLMGGTVDTSELRLLIAEVEAQKTAVGRRPLIHRAIEMARSLAYEVSYCGGLLHAICMQAGQPTHSILKSKGLQKLMTEEIEACAAAQLDYSAYTRTRREEREKGTIAAMSVVFKKLKVASAPEIRPLEHMIV